MSRRLCRRHVVGASGQPAPREQTEPTRLQSMKRVSARHQVDGRIGFEAALPLACRSGRRNRFSSFGADPLFGLQFCQGANAAARSDPDVFADALVLVLSASALTGVAAGFSAPPVFLCPATSSLDAVRLPGGTLCCRPCARAIAVADGYGFAKSYGKPTFAALENDSEISGVLNSLAVCAASRLHVVQRDT